MHDPRAVRLGQSLAHLRGDVEGVLQIHWPAGAAKDTDRNGLAWATLVVARVLCCERLHTLGVVEICLPVVSRPSTGIQ